MSILSWRLQKGETRPIFLEGRPTTELLTNRRIAWLEQYRPPTGSFRISRDSGLLRAGDHVVVWAQDFLDDKVLFENTKANVELGIEYIYILDRVHRIAFERFLGNLYDYIDKDLVNERIDIIFVKQILTMNNYVLVAPDTNRQALYSALIYDQNPFAWIKQNDGRAEAFRRNVIDLCRQIAIAQARGDPDDKCRPFDLVDQMADFSALGKHLLQRDGDPHGIHFPISEIASQISIPEDWHSSITSRG